MGRYFARLNPTLRGFLIIIAIAAVVVVLQLENTLSALGILLRVGFMLAVAYFVFLMWRERREDIAVWPRRASTAFYGAAIILVADIGAYWYRGAHGLQVIAFVGVIAGCGFAMFRIWRDMHHYS